MQLSSLSDEALLSSLHALHAENRRVVARIVLHLVEVEERSLHLTQACSSMFDFCVRKLRMSEGAAHRRLNAARLVRRFPSMLGRIERGEVHLSALVLLARHLTEANVDVIMSAVAGMSLRDVEAFLARHAPRPDAPERISKLPPADAQRPLSATSSRTESLLARRGPHRIEPLSEERYQVQLTVSTQLREKLERARDLMRHRNPTGDLSVVIERAVDALLAKLEKERLGKTTRPRRARPPKPGTIARAVRRAVFERDGEQCTYRNEAGERCPSRTLLELDHIDSRSLGGADDAANLRVRCRAHNRLHAEEVFGKDHVGERIDFRRRKSNPRVVDTSADRHVASAEQAAFDQASRGLVNMGFVRADVRRVLDDIARRWSSEGCAAPSVSDLVRKGIAALT